MKPRSLQFYTATGDETLHFQCDQGVMLLILGGDQSCALWLSQDDVRPTQFEQIYSRIHTQTNGSSYTLKMVGNSRSVKQLLLFLESKKITVLNSAIRDEAFDLIFTPRAGSVRISKSTATATTADRKKCKVLIVDDSKTIRVLLNKIISSDPELEVVGMAERPSEAEKLIEQLRPDVITLDIHMPEMNGVDFLKKYLVKYPIPTVMISSISMEEGPEVFRALEVGAVDYVQKPTADQLDVSTPIILDKIKTASRVKLDHWLSVHAKQNKKAAIKQGSLRGCRLITIGSSTGGTEALKDVLTRLPADIPPIVIVQHIPAVFSKAFADRMNALCPFEVKEAQDGDAVIPGRVLIAAGGTQMKLAKKANGELHVVVDDGPPVNRHKPSVDVLFDSVAEIVGADCVGIILTGMGGDGAKGLLRLRQLGAHTIAQNEESCVVFGMPREAIRLGAAEKIAHLDDIPELLVQFLSQKLSTKARKAS